MERRNFVVVSIASAAATLFVPVGIAFSQEAIVAGTETATTESAEETIDTIPVNVSPETPVIEPAGRTVKNRIVEEIIVTSQKREEKLQDVPISIQAFSGESVAARGIETTAQLSQIVSGFQATSMAGFALLYIRGVGTDQFIPSADPSVAQYVDGIYIVTGHGGAQTLASIERVEVLKGPQGTLFGRNATGGAISIITREPGNDFEGVAEGELGNYGRQSAKVSFSGPLTDWLSASIAGIVSEKDSFYTSDRFDLLPDKTKAARGKINFHPTENFSIGITGYADKQQSVATTTGKSTDISLPFRAINQPQANDFHYEDDYNPPSDLNQHILYAVTDWKLAWFDTKLLLSDQRVNVNASGTDFDNSPLPIVHFFGGPEFADVQTGELQFISNDDTWGSEKFKWIAGLYYLRSEAGLTIHISAAPNAATSIVQTFTGTNPDFLQSLVDAFPQNLPPLGETGLTVVTDGAMATRSYSGFVQGTYFINDLFDVTLGGRLQKERRYMTVSNLGVAPFDAQLNSRDTIANPVEFPYDPDGVTTHNFSPKGTFSFHPRENALVYASYSVGFKGGTYNVVNIYTPPNYIKPEKVTSIEIGAKVDFFDGLLRLNGAIFKNDIKDLQTGFVSLLTGGSVKFLTVPGARTRGAEFDGTLIPMPDMNPGLALTANAAYVDAKYTDFPNGEGYDPLTGIYTPNLNFDGNRIVRAPKFSGGIGAVQVIDLDNGSIELAVDNYFNSGFFFDSYNTVKQPAYSILNARASYLYEPWKVRVTLFSQNILDESYRVAVLQTDFGKLTTRGPPLEYGLRLRWDF